MFVYEIHIPAKDEDLWDNRLSLAEPATQVSTRIDPETISIEATFPDDLAPSILQMAYGGTLKPLIATGLTDGWESLPAMIGSRFLVIDSRDSNPETDRIVLQISDKEGVFVGHRHPTTLACLRMMHDLHDEERLPEAFRCLDVGCGNGILGITAGLLGAETVDGLDLCQDAITTAKANAARYALPQTRWQCTDLNNFITEQTYDLVIANLFSDLLGKSFDSLHRWLSPNGYLIISGILQRFKEPVLSAAQEANLTIIESRQRGPWITTLLGSNGQRDTSAAYFSR